MRKSYDFAGSTKNPYTKLMDEESNEMLEDLEEIKAYDIAKSDDGERIPFSQAIKEVEESRS